MTMNALIVRPWTAVCAMALLACAAASAPYVIGTLDVDGFHHATYDYHVLLQPGARSLMSSDWRLDNYAPSDEGLGNPKMGSWYITNIGLDPDGDGEADELVKMPTFDLLFEHMRNDGVVFLSTWPTSAHDSRRELSVMLRDFVESASHGGGVLQDYQRGGVRRTPAMASRILESRAVTVSGYEAHEVVYEVANVRQLEVTPDARWTRSHVVLVRTSLLFRNVYPVLMMVGYTNHPDDYDAQHPDFREFLGRIRIGSRPGATTAGASAPDLATAGGETPVPAPRGAPVAPEGPSS